MATDQCPAPERRTRRMKVERKVKQMGIQLPGLGRATYYGAS